MKKLNNIRTLKSIHKDCCYLQEVYDLPEFENASEDEQEEFLEKLGDLISEELLLEIDLENGTVKIL